MRAEGRDPYHGKKTAGDTNEH
jgi:hypothetical protein